MKYLYPADLILPIKQAWNSDFNNWYCEFPTDKSLLNILEIVYHASFLSEEDRQLHLHISYVSPKFFASSKNAIDQRAIPCSFAHPRPFLLEELLRLVPAIDPWNTSLLVCEASNLNAVTHNDLVIWGILNLRTDWERMAAGETAFPYVPPHVLTITSSNPGHVVVGKAGHAYTILKNGVIQEKTHLPLNPFNLISVFEKTLRDLDSSVAQCFGLTKLPKTNICKFWSESYYLEIIKRLFFLTARRGHGGCFLIIPADNLANALESKDLSIKYKFLMPSLWQPLIVEVAQYVASMANNHYGDLRKLFGCEPDFSEEILSNDILRRRVGGDKIKHILEDCVRLITQLSQVDGAVLLSDHLQCIGFGCEIRAIEHDLSIVKHARDFSCRTMKSIPSDSFGTRHRSAFRFCQSFPNSIALIVSQDGDVKICTKRGKDVVFWTITPPGVFFH